MPQNVIKRESTMCSKCLTPWTSGKFNIKMKPSNGKRTARRNYRIERLQLQVKSKQSSKTECKAITKRIKRLQQQNNHVAVINANLCFNHRKILQDDILSFYSYINVSVAKQQQQKSN